MDREITFTYTPALLRNAAWHFWRRYVGWSGILVELVSAALCVYFYRTDPGSWFMWLFGLVFLFGLCVFVVGYLAIVRRSMDQYRKMRSPQVTFRFSEESIRTTSDLGAAEIPWRTIDGLWKFPTIWLLMLTKVNYVTLPAAALDAELKQLITAKLER